MKSFFNLLEKISGVIGLLTAVTAAILDFLRPLGNYIYILAAVLLVLTILSVLCSKNNAVLQKIKNSSAFAPDFIKNELIELWQPDGVVFWKKGLFQVLAFLTALSMTAAVYGEGNKKGVLATNIEGVAGLQTSLGVINNKLDTISDKQDEMRKAIDLVKKETSENPRKELANRGVSWNASSFWDALIQNDTQAIRLFIDGGFKNLKEEDGSLNLIKFMKQNKDLGLFQELFDKDIFNKDILNSLYYLGALDDFSAREKDITSEVDKKNRETFIRLYKEKAIAPDSLSPVFVNLKITPLLWAIWDKNQSMVDFLIKNGASTDPVVIKADPSFSFTDHKDFVKVIDISIQDEALKNKIKIN